MKKNKIIKMIMQKEEKLIESIENFRDFLDSLEDDDLSSLGNEFYETVLDFVYTNDTLSLNDIKEFVEENYES